MEPDPGTEPAACGNCHAPLLGPYCHVCGQSIRGFVRHLRAAVEEVFDTLFNLNAWLPRTLWVLFARPGLLTREYLAGRRVRYLPPLRLFVLVSALAFFAVQCTVKVDPSVPSRTGAIERAVSAAEVLRLQEGALATLTASRHTVLEATGVAPDQDAETASIRASASMRLEQLRQAAAQGRQVPVPDTAPAPAWQPARDMLKSARLPAALERWLLARLQRIGARMDQSPEAFQQAMLSAIPTTLLLLAPLFALLLKLAYRRQQRLYMEHLLFALHTHAFVCFALLLIVLLKYTRVVGLPAHGLQDVVAAWVPLHLLLALKWVYNQPWPATLVKFVLLGLVYSTFLFMGAILTLLVILARA